MKQGLHREKLESDFSFPPEKEIERLCQKDVLLECSLTDVSFYKLSTYKLKEAGVRSIVIREILDIQVGLSSSCSGERTWEGFGA